MRLTKFPQNKEGFFRTKPHPYNLTADTAICINELPFAWRDTVFNVGTVSGNYEFSRQTSNGCDSAVSLHLTVNQLPVVTAETQNVSCYQGADGSVILHTQGSPISTYAWNPSEQNAATVSGLTTGNYAVTVTDVNGCTAATSATVRVPVSVKQDYEMYVPNVFTPNGDGTNDDWEVFFANKSAVKNGSN